MDHTVDAVGSGQWAVATAHEPLPTSHEPLATAHEPRACARCQAAPRQAHYNSKYCLPCALARRRRPASTVTPAQAEQLRLLCGVLPQSEIQQMLGLSKAAISRWLREMGWRPKWCTSPTPERVAAVQRAYEQGGKLLVQELYPDANVRSIIERYKGHARRQRRWADAQLIEAARMAGLVTPTAQARYFGRPNAYEGSITSLWIKRFGVAPGAINGLDLALGWGLVQAGCPAVLVRQASTTGGRARVLWLDAADYSRPALAPEIRQALVALAAFQAWLHGTKNSDDIRRMVYEREREYGATGTPQRHGGGRKAGGGAEHL